MSQKIRTTHVGSLPRTPELLEATQRRDDGSISDAEFNQILSDGVDRVVQRQVDLGIDIVNEGEYGHEAPGAVDYGAWWTYSFSRLGGLDLREGGNADELAASGKIQLTSFTNRRDWQNFKDVYNDPDSGAAVPPVSRFGPVITEPLTYIGQDKVATDTRELRRAVDTAGAKDGFVAAISPGAAARIPTEYYKTDEEVVWAAADALHHEYKAITDAGFTVQLDAPDLAESWDQINPEPAIEDYRAWLRIRIDAINKALEGLPKEQTRLHICWGSWHGPHVTDVPFGDIAEEILRAKVGGFSFEGASPRHEHEWRVWQDHKLPEGTLIYPGVVSHATNAVEHPRLVADRIIRFAEIVGPENVVASTDCGLGGRLHPQIAWAKLESLVKGAEIASKELF